MKKQDTRQNSLFYPQPLSIRSQINLLFSLSFIESPGLYVTRGQKLSTWGEEGTSGRIHDSGRAFKIIILSSSFFLY
ncbi:hypothetical protein [Seohaeicola zhoushanensis]|uniref:hypothetical protein n=1 Tax=Seohaeicola zhoushanensis TaxID=1569283 RepID=UPI0016793D28|nr:hypothetical protein [Seohaeicola zhoushanensis]